MEHGGGMPMAGDFTMGGGEGPGFLGGGGGGGGPDQLMAGPRGGGSPEFMSSGGFNEGPQQMQNEGLVW